jgi:hypothetical protein
MKKSPIWAYHNCICCFSSFAFHAPFTIYDFLLLRHAPCPMRHTIHDSRFPVVMYSMHLDAASPPDATVSGTSFGPEAIPQTKIPSTFVFAVFHHLLSMHYLRFPSFALRSMLLTIYDFRFTISGFYIFHTSRRGFST